MDNLKVKLICVNLVNIYTKQINPWNIALPASPK